VAHLSRGAGPDSERVVRWYAANPQLGLWCCLLLPFSAFILGARPLLRNLAHNGPTSRVYVARPARRAGTPSGVFIAAATAASAVVLAMMARHLMRGLADRILPIT
jgi:hypothetical protein